MTALQFQAMSDLHLETPKSRPTYDEFSLTPQCPYLALLGDIGHVSDPRLFDFLNRQLEQFHIIFFILGNHETYGLSVTNAKSLMRDYEASIEERRRALDSRLGRFVLLDQRRFDLSDNLTVLGCTLWSSIHPEEEDAVNRFITDFSEISNWTVQSHNAAHQSDLQWLNEQVLECAQSEPRRSIAILTHHSPTILEKANPPHHLQNAKQVLSAFATDLSDQICWTSPDVKLWAFGHTHFNCDFRDPQTGKYVLANQKGYRRSESLTFDALKTVKIDVDLFPRLATGKASKSKRTMRTKEHHCVVS